MPTGYTAKLMESGQTFPEFVLLCARAFGALITMRDDAMNAPIPEEFKPTDYYENSLRDNRAALKRLENMTNEERIRFGINEKEKAIASARSYLEKVALENSRLLKMAWKVQAWTPPSPDHTGLKSFMLQQIDTSMNHGSYWTESLNKAEAKAPFEFYSEAVESARSSIEYSLKEQEKELERVADRNRWVRQLRESLANE